MKENEPLRRRGRGSEMKWPVKATELNKLTPPTNLIILEIVNRIPSIFGQIRYTREPESKKVGGRGIFN